MLTCYGLQKTANRNLQVFPNNNDTLLNPKTMSKSKYKDHVKQLVQKKALADLVIECQTKKKTKGLIYNSLQLQPYMQNLFPSQVRTVFKCRARTLDIKDHLTYKYVDRTCRGCWSADETVSHIINCNSDDQIFMNFDQIDDLDMVRRCVLRLHSFLSDIA